MSQEENIEETPQEEPQEASAIEEEVSQEVEEKSQEQILQEQLKACEEKYIRVHAEFDNIKKRLEREKMSAIEYASEKFAGDLLPVMDALGMAVASAQTQAEPAELLQKLTEGVELTLKQFITTMEKHGIKEVTYGELDPNIHEAVMQVDSTEVESGHIAQVLQKGYLYKERTLRAAMVSVAN